MPSINAGSPQCFLKVVFLLLSTVEVISIQPFKPIHVLNERGRNRGKAVTKDTDDSAAEAASPTGFEHFSSYLDDTFFDVAEDILNEKEEEAEESMEEDDSSLVETKSSSSSASVSASHDVLIGYLSQPLDHFNSTPPPPEDATLLQRYFYSYRYVDDSNKFATSYAFLCVGGEGPYLDESVLVDSVHCTGDMLELAKLLHQEHGANVYLFALEHRYYGDSYPMFPVPYHGHEDASPVSNEHLVWLSSKQAQQDLSKFVQQKSQEELPSDTKWVTFGGSYPGFMAAWARMNFPDQIYAAVSSSAPIQIQVHFPGYKEHQAWDLQYERIGGKQECLQVVMDGHGAIADAIERGDYQHVADLFGLCDANALLEQANVDMFLGDGVLDIPAQSNDPSCQDEFCNLEQVCKALMDLTVVQNFSAMEALAAVARNQHTTDDQDDDDDLFDECLVLDWNGTLAYLSSDEAQVDGLRSWLWQTCTEVGYYQTCPKDSLCPFGRGYHELWMDYEICEVAFGLNSTTVNVNVEATRNHYSRTEIEQNGSRILSVQGDVDPWSVLSITAGDEGTMPLQWVKGASHHFWTHPPKETDDQAIQDARDLIYLKVMEWLGEGTDEGKYLQGKARQRYRKQQGEKVVDRQERVSSKHY